MNRKEKLYELQEAWSNCVECGLYTTREHLVFGEGNPEADILIIGEAPEEQEDLKGRPFVGPAGELLDGFLSTMSLDRNSDAYLTNALCCRPTVANEDAKTGYTVIENRQPSKDERNACKERLLETIYIVDPLLIVTIGRVPYQVLFGRAPKMESLRGNMQTFHMQGRYVEINYPVMPLYHTAYLSRTFDKREEGPWGKTAKDWVKICNVIDYLREAYYGIERPNREEMNG